MTKLLSASLVAAAVLIAAAAMGSTASACGGCSGYNVYNVCEGLGADDIYRALDDFRITDDNNWDYSDISRALEGYDFNNIDAGDVYNALSDYETCDGGLAYEDVYNALEDDGIANCNGAYDNRFGRLGEREFGRRINEIRLERLNLNTDRLENVRNIEDMTDNLRDTIFERTRQNISDAFDRVTANFDLK